MLTSLPTIACIVLLSVLGACVGAFINWAIYQWAVFQYRPISPWMTPSTERLADEESRTAIGSLPVRTTFHRLPIAGWWGLRSEATVFGRGHWVRPLLIEIAWAVGLPAFYLWQVGGGLTDAATTFPGGLPASWPVLAETWFWGHAVLIALMFIATFIDFDEKIIPDQVTIPGTLIALAMAAAMPWFRLPVVEPAMAGDALVSMNFGSPHIPGGWHFGWIGLLSAVGILAVWLWGLLPKTIAPGHLVPGVGRRLQLMMASIARPPRKLPCLIRTKPRSMFGLTKLCGALALLFAIALPTAFAMLPAENWTSLYGSLIGLGAIGGLVWSIRIVGSKVLGQQAMGFGDVTLMCMVGAFLGWQAGLAGFGYGIFIAVIFAVILSIVSRESHLAFGPYLCGGSLLAILWWPSTWASGAGGFFAFGPWLLVILLVSLVGMAILLPLVRAIRVRLMG